MNQKELREVVVAGSIKNPKIALVHIRGIITDEVPENSFGGKSFTTPNNVRPRLLRAISDPSVVGMLLKVSSPGGSVSASDTIYAEFEKFAKVKPVVAFIPSLGASGAYYVSCAADTIVASQGSMVGSIGVIMETINLKGLAEKLGVKPIILTTGKHKGMTSPFRDMSQEEKSILQKLLEEMKEQFVGVVKRGRPKIDQKRLNEITSGQIFSASQGLSLGLIDEIGYLHDAIKVFKNITGAKYLCVVEYLVKKPPLGNLLRLFPGIRISLTEEIVQILTNNDVGKPLYLWKPGV